MFRIKVNFFIELKCNPNDSDDSYDSDTLGTWRGRASPKRRKERKGGIRKGKFFPSQTTKLLQYYWQILNVQHTQLENESTIFQWHVYWMRLSVWNQTRSARDVWPGRPRKQGLLLRFIIDFGSFLESTSYYVILMIFQDKRKYVLWINSINHFYGEKIIR